jgi:hypothetical protein
VIPVCTGSEYNIKINAKIKYENNSSFISSRVKKDESHGGNDVTLQLCGARKPMSR